MRVGHKMTLGFLGILLLALVQIGVLVVVRQQMQRDMARIEWAEQESLAAARLHREVLAQQHDVLLYLALGGAAPRPDLERSRRAVNETLLTWGAILAAVVADVPDGNPELDHEQAVLWEISRLYHRAWDVWQRAINRSWDSGPEDLIRSANGRRTTEALTSLLAAAHQAEEVEERTVRRRMDRFQARAILAVQVMVLLGIGLPLWAAWYLQALVRRPLRRLQVAVRQITEGRFDVHTDLDRADEFGDLARALAAMAQELGRTTTSITRLREEVHERHVSERRLLEVRRKLRSMASQAAVAEERERRRVAGGLHDDVCQKLVLCKLNLQILERRIQDDDARTRFAEQYALLDETITALRDLSFDLGNPLLHEMGLDTALSSWLNRSVPPESGMRCSVVSPAGRLRLSEAVGVLLYRAVCELVTNAIKYAQASHLTVRLDREDDWVTVTVADDGVGFDVAAYRRCAATHTGTGLFNISERVEDMGGTCEVDARPGAGTRVTLRLPDTVPAPLIVELPPRDVGRPGVVDPEPG